MIRTILLTSFMILSLSSCLKQSIADAMLEEERGGPSGTATLTYTINGNTVTNAVSDQDNQLQFGYHVLCSKTVYPASGGTIYILEGIGETGNLTFVFGTDSLKVGNYGFKGFYGEMYILSYNNTSGFVYYPTDSISFNITSYDKGRISGNFSGVLTPMISASSPNNVYGTPSSVLITDGSFKNVPVFY